MQRLNYPITTLTGNHYFADIAIPSEKRIIEYDHPYWHDENEDKIRDERLVESGWTVSRVKAD